MLVQAIIGVEHATVTLANDSCSITRHIEAYQYRTSLDCCQSSQVIDTAESAEWLNSYESERKSPRKYGQGCREQACPSEYQASIYG